MKIAMVFNNMIFGGIERVGISYVKLFKEMGYEVDVYVLNPDTEDIIKELSDLCSVEIINFSKKKCPEAYWGAAKKFSWGPYAFSFIYAGLKLVQPILKRVYGRNKEYDIAIAFSGHYNDLTFVADDFIKSKAKVAWLHGTEYEYHMLSAGFGRLYAKIKNLVSLSNLGDGSCIKFHEQKQINKERIYNPVVINKNTDNLKVQELKAQYGDFCLKVARIAKDKDQKTAILALKEANARFEQHKKLLLVGDGELRAEVEQFVKDNDMDSEVVFIGSVTDVQNYYAAAAVYVHSSPLEGLPTVLLEAMSFGLPIASTDSIPGVREILEDNRCGLISKVGDYKELGENIYKLYTDEDLCKELVKESQIKLQEFSPDYVKKQVERLFSDLVKA